MILTRTPLRISLFGGGSDLPAFYRSNQGRVLSGAINKYIHVALGKRFDGRTRVCYSQTETVDDPADLKHNLTREILLKENIRGVDVAFFSDAPPNGCGLGSSSALAVGLIHAIRVMRCEEFTKQAIAEDACRVEMDLCHKPIGKQDQYAAAVGGVREWIFGPGESGVACCHRFHPQAISLDMLADTLLLFYTGVGRDGDRILAEQSAKTLTHLAALSQMVSTAETAAEMLRVGRVSVSELGRLLHQSWTLKKTLAGGISDPKIDAWYDAALLAGAAGGKCCGAGGGGFLLFIADPKCHNAIRKALPDLRYVPFRWDHAGTTATYIGE